MLKIKHNQGFSIITVVIAIAIVAVITLGGWLVWQNRQENQANNNQTAEDTSIEVQPESSDASGMDQVDPTEGGKYLVIDEWGVKIPLSDSIRDAYYAFEPAGDEPVERVRLYDAAFDRLKNANGESCGEGTKFDFYAIEKVRPKDVAQLGEQAGPEYKKFSFTDEWLFGGLAAHQAPADCEILNEGTPVQEDRAISNIVVEKKRRFGDAFNGLRASN